MKRKTTEEKDTSWLSNIVCSKKNHLLYSIIQRVCMSVKSNYVNRNKIADITVWEMDLSLFC